jgi:hypothetical protein
MQRNERGVDATALRCIADVPRADAARSSLLHRATRPYQVHNIQAHMLIPGPSFGRGSFILPSALRPAALPKAQAGLHQPCRKTIAPEKRKTNQSAAFSR